MSEPRPGDNRYPDHGSAWYEDEAERLARRVHGDLAQYVASIVRMPIARPPDAGLIAMVREVARQAFEDGGKETWAQLYAEEQEAARDRHARGYPS